MADSIPAAELLRRYEAAIRANERLQHRLDELDPAVGHTAVLVRLAAAVRQWQRDGKDESLQQIEALANEYYLARGAGPSSVADD